MRRRRNHPGHPQKAEGQAVEDVRDSCTADIESCLIPFGIGLRKGAQPVPVLERHPVQPGWVGKGLSRNLACDEESGHPTVQGAYRDPYNFYRGPYETLKEPL